MRFMSGVLVFVLGVTLAGFYFYSSDDREDQLERATQIATRPSIIAAPSVPVAQVSNTRPSSNSPVTSGTMAPSVGDASAAAAALKSAKLSPLPLLVRDRPAVAIETSALAKPEAKLATLQAPVAATPSSEEAKNQLARDLQRELKRVGCYDGDVDGDWGPGSRRAMASFIERVNAALPIEQPDYILLTLVQGHKQQACGAGCPSGQGMTEAGRCLPQSVISAQAQRRNERPPGDKVIADAGKLAERDIRSGDASPVTPRWTATVKPAIAAVAPAKVRDAVIASNEQPALAPFAMPGRMTLGGSVGGAAPLQSSSASSASSAESNGAVIWAQSPPSGARSADKPPFRLAAIDKATDPARDADTDTQVLETRPATNASSAAREPQDASTSTRLRVLPHLERSAPLPPVVVYRAPRPVKIIQSYAQPSFAPKPVNTARWSRNFFSSKDLSGR